ncbi:Uncharacterised protein [Legionella pneumophila]|uniref:hypothetical protein n=1 Tax=Legionella pneumophila TaxID=446 RepID=UPI000770777A|nr:hypothetical protein [Legionella pneumophila]CZI81387.1 Uncharacterised protein [Legionella pneumophila]CZI83243.1 Uncharacterised protein [Legionella pneumophila]HAT9170702.1 hypothetical protein [Legionella pneumophila subsp. pneumophila]
MDSPNTAIQLINIDLLKHYAEGLVQAMCIASLYSNNNPGIKLAKLNLHGLKNIIKKFDYK